MRQQFTVFLIRLALNSVGLWVAVKLFGTGIDEQLSMNFGVFILAGFIFSVVNAVLKPIVIIMSLPAILLTLGLFTVVVNGLMVYISLKIAPGLDVTFFHAILVGLVMSLVNYIISSALEIQMSRQGEYR